MNKIFSHRVTLQIVIVVLIILLSNTFIQNRDLKEYLYDRLGEDLEGAMYELNLMNEAMFLLYSEGSLENGDMDEDSISYLTIYDREIKNILDLTPVDFDWLDLKRIIWNIDDMNEKSYLTPEDKQYLKKMYKYNQRILAVYHESLKENKIDIDDFDENQRKAKKTYKDFMMKASNIVTEEEYRKLKKYRVDRENKSQKKDLGINEEKYLESSLSLEEAKGLTIDILEKLFGEKAILVEEKDIDQDEYEFDNKWQGGKEENLYNISIDKEYKSLSMYKRVQSVTKAHSGEYLDEKAREIKDILVPKDYIYYERKERFDEGKIEEIEYRFIKKTKDIYDEAQRIKIRINSFGALSNLYMSDPLNNKEINIEKPKLTKEDILSKLNKEDIKHILLVKDREGDLQYRVFLDFNGEFYTYVFDADTGEKIDIRKSEEMYFKKLDDM